MKSKLNAREMYLLVAKEVKCTSPVDAYFQGVSLRSMLYWHRDECLLCDEESGPSGLCDEHAHLADEIILECRRVIVEARGPGKKIYDVVSHSFTTVKADWNLEFWPERTLLPEEVEDQQPKQTIKHGRWKEPEEPEPEYACDGGLVGVPVDMPDPPLTECALAGIHHVSNAPSFTMNDMKNPFSNEHGGVGAKYDFSLTKQTVLCEREAALLSWAKRNFTEYGYCKPTGAHLYPEIIYDDGVYRLVLVCPECSK